MAALGELGIRCVYDLRSDAERDLFPETDRLPPGAAYVVADVLGDNPDGSPAAFMPLMTDPARAREVLGDGRGIEMFQERYRDFVLLPSARAAFGRLFTGLADPTRLPALFHCGTGKDRTGWAAAALLWFFGVPDDAVMADFLASNAEPRPIMTEVVGRFVALGGAAALLEPLTMVRADYLDTAVREMHRAFGTIDDYVESGLGLDLNTRRRLRDTFLVPA